MQIGNVLLPSHKTSAVQRARVTRSSSPFPPRLIFRLWSQLFMMHFGLCSLKQDLGVCGLVLNSFKTKTTRIPPADMSVCA